MSFYIGLILHSLPLPLFMIRERDPPGREKDSVTFVTLSLNLICLSYVPFVECSLTCRTSR